MQRRRFLQTLGAAPPVALATQATLAAGTPTGATGKGPDEPKVMFYDDGRHAAPVYQYAGPLKPEDFLVTVDQLVGSGFDSLVYFAGLEGGIALYDSKVAQSWGDNVEKWKHPVWYRGARHLQALIAAGQDPLRLICDRCHEKGLWCIAANYIGLQGNDREIGGSFGRQSDFVYDHPQFRVGKDSDPRAGPLDPKRFSFLHAGLREERLRVFNELFTRYETDGVEVNLVEFVPFCKFHQVGQLAPVLTEWFRELRALATRAEQVQGRRKRIYVRIPEHPAAWKLLGYEVPVWVEEQLVDGLVCLPGLMESPMEQDVDLEAAVGLTRGTTCRVIGGMSQIVGRQFHYNASQTMIWAAAANVYRGGADGFAVVTYCWFPNGWPWTAQEYETTRRLAHPELLAHADKHYHVRSRPRQAGPAHDWLPGMGQSLPMGLQEGEPVSVEFSIADELVAADAEGKIDAVHLRIRLTNVEPALNEIRMELNGKRLPEESLRLHDCIYRQHESGTINPYGYIYDFRLAAVDFPVPGRNRVSVTLLRQDPLVDWEIDLYDVDCIVKYRIHRDFDLEITRM
jgi:hypothetical protein